MIDATTLRPVTPVPALQKATLPEAPPKPPPLSVSPKIRIDTELSLVVMEFRKPDGEVRDSIPTPREIEAYRNPPLTAPRSALDLKG